jgi:hypothetical protein
MPCVLCVYVMRAACFGSRAVIYYIMMPQAFYIQSYHGGITKSYAFLHSTQ